MKTGSHPRIRSPLAPAPQPGRHIDKKDPDLVRHGRGLFFRWRDLARFWTRSRTSGRTLGPLPYTARSAAQAPLSWGALTETSDLSVGLPGSKTRLATIAAVSRPLAHIPALFEDDLRHRSYRPHQECTHSIQHCPGKVKDHMSSDIEKSVLRRNIM